MVKVTTPTRTPKGKRHEINIEIGIGNQVSNLRATCICGALDAPARFGRTRAEEDGREHLDQYAKKGMPPGRRGKVTDE